MFKNILIRRMTETRPEGREGRNPAPRRRWGARDSRVCHPAVRAHRVERSIRHAPMFALPDYRRASSDGTQGARGRGRQAEEAHTVSHSFVTASKVHDGILRSRKARSAMPSRCLARSRGRRGALLGSVTNRVLAHSKLPVRDADADRTFRHRGRQRRMRSFRRRRARRWRQRRFGSGNLRRVRESRYGRRAHLSPQAGRGRSGGCAGRGARAQGDRAPTHDRRP